MHPSLKHNLYLVKEHVGFFKVSHNYDIFDPQSGQKFLECREPKVGPFTKVFRFSKYKRQTPFHLHVQTPEGEPVLSVRRGVALLTSQVDVFDGNGQRLGGFRQKLFSLGGAFDLEDATGQKVCRLQGKFTGWEFRFLAGETELGKVTKKWTGLGKELFTSADNYILQINEMVPVDSTLRALIVAGVLSIDLVLKE